MDGVTDINELLDKVQKYAGYCDVPNCGGSEYCADCDCGCHANEAALDTLRSRIKELERIEKQHDGGSCDAAFLAVKRGNEIEALEARIKELEALLGRRYRVLAMYKSRVSEAVSALHSADDLARQVLEGEEGKP